MLDVEYLSQRLSFHTSLQRGEEPVRYTNGGNVVYDVQPSVLESAVYRQRGESCLPLRKSTHSKTDICPPPSALAHKVRSRLPNHIHPKQENHPADCRSALFYFGFRQRGMMRKYSLRHLSADASIRKTSAGDAWHADLMAYLGGMNSSLALLAYLRLYALFFRNRGKSLLLSTGSKAGDIPLDVVALSVLCLANFSQAFLNFTVGRKGGRWITGKGLDAITLLDALFTVLDALAVWSRVRAVAVQREKENVD